VGEAAHGCEFSCQSPRQGAPYPFRCRPWSGRCRRAGSEQR
jgi:hypothetical protein